MRKVDTILCNFYDHTSKDFLWAETIEAFFPLMDQSEITHDGNTYVWTDAQINLQGVLAVTVRKI